MATDKTKLEYVKLAKNFYLRLAQKGLKLTVKNIADELLGSAPGYRPDYWRRLRCALAYHQKDQGYDEAAKRTLGLRNPVTAKGSKTPVKKKQNRVKTINSADENALITYFKEHGDMSMAAAIILFKYSGIRPAELAGVKVDGTKLTIEGAKKSHNGTRGADRTLQFEGTDPRWLAAVVREAQLMNIGAMQDKLRFVGKKLWPRRKSLPTFYSWRHQLGSELKASGLDRLRIAYLMGHQATASVDRYGNRKTAKGGVLPGCPADADLSHIRVTHDLPSADKKGYSEPTTKVMAQESSQESHSNEQLSGMAAFISSMKINGDDFSLK